MELYSPGESKKYITKVDMAGGVFEYEGEKDFGVYMGYYPIPLELAQEVINDIKFPLKWLDIPLFLLPFRLMVYDKGWTGLEYNGRAYPSHIVYGARKEKPTKESIGALIVHEIGHALCYKFVDPCYVDFRETPKFKEYRRLRGIPDHWTDKSHFWSRRPSEVWAEDFRYLFGPDYARQEEFLHYGSVELDPPGEEIGEFMLSLLPEGSGKVRKFNKLTIEQVKQLLKNTERKINQIHIHHTWKPDKKDYKGEETIRAIWRYHTRQNGWIDIGYHFEVDPDGTIWDGRPLDINPASIKGHNKGAVAIAIIGNFDEEQLVSPQREAVIKLIMTIQDVLGLTNEDIIFHREYSSKTCPGKNIDKQEFLEWINAWRRSLKEKREEKYKIVDVAPFLYKGRVCFSLRHIVEAIGGYIEKWDEKTKTAVARIGDKRITVQVGNSQIKIEEVG